MDTETIPLEETNCFSRFFLDYIKESDSLKPFYDQFPKIENFQETISKKTFSREKRNMLSEVLSEQYQATEKASLLTENLELLKKDSTYTITTGHQLNIFTGPLYFIYKLISVVNACKKLKAHYPQYDFVPIYWMASEDHDFDEINHFFLSNQKYTWETNQAGAVGHFDPSSLKTIADKFPDSVSFFKEAYKKSKLADSVRYYVNQLLGEDGLIVLDADDHRLKSLFREVMIKDIIDNESADHVNESTHSLEGLGYKPQINAREINFFYLEESIRARLEKVNSSYKVVDHDISFSESEMKNLIERQPEKLSPNVTLRPLYQEVILPNLAYIGGPSEMVYWLQLKKMFQHYQVAFPILLPRNYALIISKKLQSKWLKTRLPFSDVFKTKDEALKKWTLAFSSYKSGYEKEIEQIKLLIDSMQSKASGVDITLLEHLDALKTQFTNKIQKAELKLLRAEKRKQVEKQKQISDIKDELFPEGTPQERKENFMSFYFQNPMLLQNLKDAFDPFNFEMYLLFE